MHGGATLTFADYALCLVAGRAADGGTNTSFAMTVSIAVEFLAPARSAPPLEATGEPLQVTGRLAFARGSITQEGSTIALWSGVCRHVARAKAMARKDEAAPARATRRRRPCRTDFELLSNASVYSRHIGPSYARKESDGATLIQPTLPHMCNSGGVLHGGYMMSFAEFGGDPRRGPRHRHGAQHRVLRRRIPRRRRAHGAAHTRVEVPRHGKSLAFLRGLLEQDGKPLLSYSATIKLGLGVSAGGARLQSRVICRSQRRRATGVARPSVNRRHAGLLGDAAHFVPEQLAQAADGLQVLGLGGALDRLGDLAQRRRADHARSALQPVGGAGDGGEVVGFLDLALGRPRGLEELALDLGQRGGIVAEQLDELVAVVSLRAVGVAHAAVSFSQTSRVALSCSIPSFVSVFIVEMRFARNSSWPSLLRVTSGYSGASSCSTTKGGA